MLSVLKEVDGMEAGVDGEAGCFWRVSLEQTLHAGQVLASLYPVNKHPELQHKPKTASRENEGVYLHMGVY